MGSAWNFMAIHATLVEIFQSGPTNRVTLPSPVIATSTGGKEMQNMKNFIRITAAVVKRSNGHS